MTTKLTCDGCGDDLAQLDLRNVRLFLRDPAMTTKIEGVAVAGVCCARRFNRDEYPWWFQGSDLAGGRAMAMLESILLDFEFARASDATKRLFAVFLVLAQLPTFAGFSLYPSSSRTTTRAPAPRRRRRSTAPFARWLRRQTERTDAVGDLARDVTGDPSALPFRDLRALLAYLRAKHASPETIGAANRAWREHTTTSQGRPRDHHHHHASRSTTRATRSSHAQCTHANYTRSRHAPRRAADHHD